MSKHNVKITVVGCGDAFSSGEHAQSCFAVKDGHGLFTVDFGATSMLALQQQDIDFQEIDLVAITHLHGDHFGGLPYLIMAREYVAKQKRPLHIIGPAGTKHKLQQLIECCYPGHGYQDWTLGLKIMEIDIDSSCKILGRTFYAYEAKHYVGNEPCLSLRIETCGKILGFSGDTGWVDKLIKVAHKSDVFFCECNYFTPQDYDGHMDYAVLQGNLNLLESKQIVLNHLGPQMLDNFSEIDLPVAYEGMVINV